MMTATPIQDVDFGMIRTAADGVLADNAAILQAFRERTATLFRAMLKDAQQPFKRRPPVSLRLICEGDPPAKLIVHPDWDRYKKAVNPEFACCELLEERFVTVQGQRAKKLSERINFRIGDKPQYLNHRPRVGLMHQTGVSDARRAIEVIREFVNDHRVIFARSHDHCCICGKALTDELSRSRGIGPECIKKLDWGVFSDHWSNRVIVPDAIDAQAMPPPAPIEADEERFVLVP
jgi:hypothetical protein